jgi:hypothetical protein
MIGKTRKVSALFLLSFIACSGFILRGDFEVGQPRGRGQAVIPELLASRPSLSTNKMKKCRVGSYRLRRMWCADARSTCEFLPNICYQRPIAI